VPVLEANSYHDEGGDEDHDGDQSQPWSHVPQTAEAPNYHRILEEALSRLEHLDTSHRTSLNLILGEMDRLPSGSLWMMLASRLEVGTWMTNWTRYQSALKRFQEPGIWGKAAGGMPAQLPDGVAPSREDIAGQFRGAGFFKGPRRRKSVRRNSEQPRLGPKSDGIVGGLGPIQSLDVSP